VPNDEEEWKLLFKEAKLKHRTIHGIPWEEMGSGSDINERQFITFRAYHPHRLDLTGLSNGIHLYGLENTRAPAKTVIDFDDEFIKYLNS